jgi:hypothetical protein
MSSAGLDYFANLNKYKGEATASMDTYRNHALEKVREGNKGVQEKIDAVQKAGLGVSALGIAMKSINKQIPKSWLKYDAGDGKGYNFGEKGNHLHSTQMEKGGGDGLHYEVPEENFNSPRQPRPGDRMRSAINQEPEGIYERLTEPTNLDSNVSSQIPDTDAETNVDVASPRATQIQGDEAETNIDLASPRVDSADVEPNVINDTQTYQARGGDESGAGRSENVMSEDQARQFTQQDSIYEEGIDSEIQKQPVQSLEESRNKIQANAEEDILGDELQPAQIADDLQPSVRQNGVMIEPEGSGVNLVDRRVVGADEYPSFLEVKGGADPTQPIHPTKNPGGFANKGGEMPTQVSDVQPAIDARLKAENQGKLDSLTDGATEAEDLLDKNKGGSAISAEDQGKLDSLTDGATEAEDLLEKNKTAVGEGVEKGAVAGEGSGEAGGLAGDVAGDLAGDALLGEAGGEEAVAVGIDAAGMASGVGEAVGAALLLGSLAYELSQSSVMKGKESAAEQAMPTQAASYGGADIQSSGSTGRGIV